MDCKGKETWVQGFLKGKAQAVLREAAEQVQEAKTLDKQVQSCLGHCVTTNSSACGFCFSGLYAWDKSYKLNIAVLHLVD